MYLSEETQFSLSIVSTTIYNTPPRLVSLEIVTMEEDSGRINFQEYSLLFSLYTLHSLHCYALKPTLFIVSPFLHLSFLALSGFKESSI